MPSPLPGARGPGLAVPGDGPGAPGPGPLGVNYWKLKFDLRAKLECWIFGAVLPFIWWISGGVGPTGAVAADIRADSTLIRR